MNKTFLLFLIVILSIFLLFLLKFVWDDYKKGRKFSKNYDFKKELKTTKQRIIFAFVFFFVIIFLLVSIDLIHGYQACNSLVSKGFIQDEWPRMQKLEADSLCSSSNYLIAGFKSQFGR